MAGSEGGAADGVTSMDVVGAPPGVAQAGAAGCGETAIARSARSSSWSLGSDDIGGPVVAQAPAWSSVTPSLGGGGGGSSFLSWHAIRATSEKIVQRIAARVAQIPGIGQKFRLVADHTIGLD